MSTVQEQNKRLIRRFFGEGVNQDKQDVLDEIIALQYVNHNMPVTAPGPEGLGQILGMFKAGFPDLHVTVEAVIAENDLVMTRGYMTGTHAGPFMNVPPTGNAIKVGYIDIWRIENGQALENWVQMDMLGLLQQLGAIPTPA
jgi:predicted ester cyclase